MKKIFSLRVFFVFGLIFTSSFLFADDLKLEDAVSPNYLKELKSSGVVKIIHEKDDAKLNLLPECAYKSQAEKAIIEKTDKNVPFVAEFL